MSFLAYYEQGGVRYYNGRPVQQVAEKPGTMTYRILQVIGETPVSAAEMADILNSPKDQTCWALGKLAQRKFIQRKKIGGRWHYWRAA